MMSRRQWFRKALAGLAAPYRARGGGLEQAPIGYFGPADPSHPLGGTSWMGFRQGLEEASSLRQSRFDFQIVQAWDESPWTGGASVVVRMVYRDRIWALVASITGEATHLAEQVIAKARVPMIDPGSTDRTANAAFVPWMFSLVPDDRLLMCALGEALLQRAPGASFFLVSSTAHDSRMQVAELWRFLNRERARPARHFEFQPGSERIEGLAQEVGRSGAKAAVILAGAMDTARFMRALRGVNPDLPLFGGPDCGRAWFAELAGAAAEGVCYPDPLQRGQQAQEFCQRFVQRFGREPDWPAYFAYDAAFLITSAIDRAGPDPFAIREAIQELSGWQGISGEIRWDRLGRNSRPVRVAQLAGTPAGLVPEA